jgi:quercetin dioxygenase-like cupin family protein
LLVATQFVVFQLFDMITFFGTVDDGTEIEGGPGDVAVVPPGHNTWVLGNEPCVIIDFTGVEDWVKSH